MRNLKIVTWSSIVLLFSSPVWAQAADEIPLRIERISDNLIVLRCGNEYVTNVSALATDRGLVVVDTNMIPSMAPKLRKIIEGEFERADFAYVINTHSHWDHTLGNHAFQDIVIVGHRLCIPAMKKFEAELPGFIKRRREWLADLEARLPSLDPDSWDARTAPQILANNRMLLPELEAGVKIVPPNLTFNDRLTIDMGGATLKLYYYGKSHTDTDILILVPEEKVLFVGDLFSKEWLPYIGEDVDIPRNLEVLGEVLAEAQIEHVITGHHEFLTVDDLRIHFQYPKDLWDTVVAAQEKGLSLEETKKQLSFETRFNHLTSLIHVWEGQDYHLSNIENVWKLVTEQRE